MANYSNIKEVKARLEELGKRLVNKDYASPQEKHDIHRERWILKNQLAALESGNTSYFIDWLDKKGD